MTAAPGLVLADHGAAVKIKVEQLLTECRWFKLLPLGSAPIPGRVELGDDHRRSLTLYSGAGGMFT